MFDRPVLPHNVDGSKLMVYNYKEIPIYNLCLNCNVTDQL